MIKPGECCPTCSSEFSSTFKKLLFISFLALSLTTNIFFSISLGGLPYDRFSLLNVIYTYRVPYIFSRFVITRRQHFFNKGLLPGWPVPPRWAIVAPLPPTQRLRHVCYLHVRGEPAEGTVHARVVPFLDVFGKTGLQAGQEVVLQEMPRGKPIKDLHYFIIHECRT